MARFFAPIALLALAAVTSTASADVVSDAVNAVSNTTAVSDALKDAANASGDAANDVKDAASSIAGDIVDKVSNVSTADVINAGKDAASTIGDVIDKAGSLGEDAISAVKNATKNGTSVTPAPASPATTNVASVVVISLSAVTAAGFTML